MKNKKNNIYFYLDYAAATPIDPRVQREIEKNRLFFGNPSSLHLYGLEAKKVLDRSRAKIADLMGAKEQEIFFCSGGSESDSWVMQGVAEANKENGKHVIVSAIEHKAILNTAKFLAKGGFKVDLCPVDQDGLVIEEELEKMIGEDTILISIMYANNEIGVVQNIARLVDMAKKKNPRVLFHTDACQAVNYLDIDVRKLGVDLMTINGSKIYGPRSVGVTYIKKGTRIMPLIFGGGQEYGMRSGTENVAEISGMALALDIAKKIQSAENKRLYVFQQKIFSVLKKNIDHLEINGSVKQRLCNNVNVSIAGVEGETLVLYLDNAGFAVSTGSACSASDLKPSHVLLAIGQSEELSHSSLRISLGRYTSEEAVDSFLNIVSGIVTKIRKMSAI